MDAYIIRIIRPGFSPVQFAIDLTVEQISGIIIAASIIDKAGIFPWTPIRWGGNPSIEFFQGRIRQQTLFVSSRRAHLDILNSMLQFNPRSQNLLDFISSSGYQLEHQPSQRYILLFRVPNYAVVLEFNDLQFLQGIISAVGWVGFDYHDVVPVVYDNDVPMEIA